MPRLCQSTQSSAISLPAASATVVSIPTMSQAATPFVLDPLAKHPGFPGGGFVFVEPTGLVDVYPGESTVMEDG